MSFPLITDPYFYAVAIPAVLMLGVSKSGFGAGFGSLAVPVMALAVTVPQAAAILMPVLLLMDLLGLAAFRRDFDFKFLKFLVPFGLVGTLVGALLFARAIDDPAQSDATLRSMRRQLRAEFCRTETPVAQSNPASAHDFLRPA